MNKTNDPGLKSWISHGVDSDFPVQNLPYGIARFPGGHPVPSTRIGDTVINLEALAEKSYIDIPGLDLSLFSKSVLNDFIASGKPNWHKLRDCLSGLFISDNPVLRDNAEDKEAILHPAGTAEMLMPVKAGDYTDFYSSEEHARNLGKLFRDEKDPLLPNWKHMPVAYHGRSSSIVVSGTPVHRPRGQIKQDYSPFPEFLPSQQLDFELEVAFITGIPSVLGVPVSTAAAEDHIFGLVLFNDLTARDLQRWEYVPLGPFTSKNFASVISPWIVTLDALEPFRVSGPHQDPQVLSYLSFLGNHHFDIHLGVYLQPEDQEELPVCSTNYRNLYWNIAQQLAHQTVSGCNINTADFYASGTISGNTPESFGSLIERTVNGTKPFDLGNGIKRTFLEDHDTVIFRGFSEKVGLRVGFGEAVTRILPAME